MVCRGYTHKVSAKNPSTGLKSTGLSPQPPLAHIHCHPRLTPAPTTGTTGIFETGHLTTTIVCLPPPQRRRFSCLREVLPRKLRGNPKFRFLPPGCSHELYVMGRARYAPSLGMPKNFTRGSRMTFSTSTCSGGMSSGSFSSGMSSPSYRANTKDGTSRVGATARGEACAFNQDAISCAHSSQKQS